MDLIKSVVSTASGLLNDPSTEQANNASDRVGGMLGANASLASQASVQIKYGFFPPTSSADRFKSQGTDSKASQINPSKLVELGSGTMTSTVATGEEMVKLELPKAFWKNKSFPAHGQTRYYRSVRCSFDFEIQVNAATGCSGSIIALYVPDGVDLTKINQKTWPMFASTIINIGPNTSGKLHVPYVCDKNYVNIDSAELGSFVIACWTPLLVPTGTPNEVSLTVYGAISDLDLQAPKPVAQGPHRNKIEIAEGVGLMNLSNSSVTRKAQYISLCGESAEVDCTTAGMSRAVTDVMDILKIPYIQGKVSEDTIYTPWAATAAKGDSIYDYNVHFDGINPAAGLMSGAFRYCRGSVIFTVNCYNSTLHKGRLKICFFPLAEGEEDYQAYTEEEANNAFFVVHDIGLNSSMDLVVPFSSNTWLRGSKEAVGRLSIFVNSKLSVTPATSNSISFTVTARLGDDFEYYTPYNSNMVLQAGEMGDGVVEDNTAAAASSAGMVAPEEMDKEDYLNEHNPGTGYAMRIQKVQIMRAVHTNINALFGRAQYVGRYTVGADTGHVFDLPIPVAGYWNIPKMFHFFTGDLNIHIYNATEGPVKVAHSYTQMTESSLEFISSLGCVVVPTQQFASLTVPWYFDKPVRYFRGERPLGNIILYTLGHGKVFVWVSFTNLKLFQPIGVPKLATLRTWLKDGALCNCWNLASDLALNASNALDEDEPLMNFVTHNNTRVTNLDKLMEKTEEAGWLRDLTREGVEENPGPNYGHQDRNQAFTRINLCYMKNEEGSFHYGLKVQGFVLHRPKGNILNEEHYWRKPVLSQMSGWTVCPEDYVSGSRMLDNLLLGSTMEIIHDPKGLFFGPETPFIMSWMAKYIAASYIPIQHRRNTWDEEVLFEEEFDDYHQEGGWIRDLTAEGVEPNPGPLVELVYKQRGLYRHYGMRHNGQVLHMSTDNILMAAVDQRVPIVLVDDDGTWVKEESVDITSARMAAIERSATMPQVFSADNNCETWAKDALGIKSITQARALLVFGLIMASVTGVMTAGQTGLTQKVVDGVKNAYQGSKNMFSAMGETIKGFFKEQIFDAIKCDITKTLFKLILRTVCYGICFCSSPGLLTGAAVGTLIAMDLANVEGLTSTTKDLLTALLNGDMGECAAAMSNIIYENSSDREMMVRTACEEFSRLVGENPDKVRGQGPFSGFNEASLAAKNFEYWFGKIRSFFFWLKSFFVTDEEGKIATWFEDNMEIVARYASEADEVLAEYMNVNNRRDANYQRRVKSIVKQMTVLKNLAVRAHCVPALTLVSQLLPRLQHLNLPPAVGDGIFRFEPIGVWLSGGPGCGKSMLASLVMKGTSEELERRGHTGTKEVYTEAGGSQFYDNYRNQFFHIIDDIGQCREEEDLKLICQVISSIPFTVPMADLAEKGTQYSSKIVIATTNRTDFASVVLTSDKALQRRFPFCYTIRVREKYRVVDTQLLDVLKAQADGSLERGHCWEYDRFGSSKNFKILDLKELTSLVADRFQSKMVVTHTMNQGLTDFQQFPTSRVCVTPGTLEHGLDTIDAEDVTKRGEVKVQAPGPRKTWTHPGPQDTAYKKDIHSIIKNCGFELIAKQEYATKIMVFVKASGGDVSADLRRGLQDVCVSDKKVVVFYMVGEEVKDSYDKLTYSKKSWDGSDNRVEAVFVLDMTDRGVIQDTTMNSHAIGELRSLLGENDEEVVHFEAPKKDIMDQVFSVVNYNADYDEEVDLSTDEKCLSYLEVAGEESPFKHVQMQRKDGGFVEVGCKLPLSAKIAKWYDGRITAWKTWYKRHKYVLQGISIAVGILTAIAGICTAWGVLRRHISEVNLEDVKKSQILDFLEEKQEKNFFGGDAQGRAYGGGPGLAVKKKKVVVGQGFAPAEYAHLYKRCVTMEGPDGKRFYGMVTASKQVLTYKHYFKMGGRLTTLWYDNLAYTPAEDEIELEEVEYYDDKGVNYPSDCVLINFEKLPFNMKTGMKFLAPPKSGDSGVLIYGGKDIYSQGVENVQTMNSYSALIANKHTTFIDGISYQTRNMLGMCGGLVCQKQNGAWKIIGMHHAGDSMMFGNAFRIKVGVVGQGVVTEIRKNPIPVFNPTRSKIMKSPLYGVVETRMGPAPLHPHDPRVEEEIPHLVKHAAAKYRVDKFEPDEENLNRAMMQTASQLFAVTGRCGRWTIEEALSGGGGNPVDLTTSPGRKYTLKKLQKKDLVHRNENGILVPTPSFREDVNEAVRRIERGEAQTTFVANLKDELRPLAKIKAGGARCIEMCEFDYVVAHRMILGPMFEKIYNAEMTSTGIAVGCNPYTDFNLFFGTASENWIAIDYSRYDGSLSEGLMRKGVEVLAACHEDPELVEKLLEPVVMSTHLVADEEWFVKGGMPSGSPCTSVLNSVCNLIVVKTACLSAGVEKPEDIQIVTYGDDVLMTIDYDFCDDALPEIIHSQFGMEATSANKLSKTLKVSPADATFLKRSFRLFPDTQFVTGVLDLENMMQKIQWCHGKEAFIQQWTSFTQELVLHGRETYERVIRLCSPRLDQYKIFTPRYDQRYKEVYQSIFM